MESLRSKFVRLEDTKKPTNDLSCPPPTRSAKQTGRTLLEKINAMSVGAGVDSNEENREDVYFGS